MTMDPIVASSSNSTLRERTKRRVLGFQTRYAGDALSPEIFLSKLDRQAYGVAACRCEHSKGIQTLEVETYQAEGPSLASTARHRRHCSTHDCEYMLPHAWLEPSSFDRDQPHVSSPKSYV